MVLEYMPIKRRIQRRRRAKLVKSMPKDASYQGVNDKGNPMFYSKKTGKFFESLQGWGTPMFGKPRGKLYRVI